MDEPLHPFRAFLLHLIGHMTVDVKRKGCGMMSEVFLHRFDVITGFQRSDRIAVPEVMKTSIGEARRGNKAFEVEIQRPLARRAARSGAVRLVFQKSA